ncbi:MAG: HD domain-containing phosphohydrolase [Bacteriovoracaceae bacterium]
MSELSLTEVKLDEIKTHTDMQFDIYVIIEEKPRKIIASNSQFYTEEIEHFQKKDINKFYIDEIDFQRMVAKIPKQEPIQAKSTNSLETSEYLYKLVQSKLQLIGIAPDEIEQCTQKFNKFLNTLQKSPRPVMDKLYPFLNRKDYIVSHSMLVAHIANLMAKEMSWFNESITQKIYYAALFKDIFIEDPQLAKIRSSKQAEFTSLTSIQKKIVLGHQEKTVKLLLDMPEFTSDVESLIMNHHELPNGEGFNNGKTTEHLSQLCCTFNIACYFVQDILERHESIGPLGIYREMEITFKQKNYKMPYEALRKVLRG